MFTLLYGKFTQDNTHQTLSESAGFCGRYDTKHFGVFFGSQCRSGDIDVIRCLMTRITLARSINGIQNLRIPD